LGLAYRPNSDIGDLVGSDPCQAMAHCGLEDLGIVG